MNLSLRRWKHDVLERYCAFRRFARLVVVVHKFDLQHSWDMQEIEIAKRLFTKQGKLSQAKPSQAQARQGRAKQGKDKDR